MILLRTVLCFYIRKKLVSKIFVYAKPVEFVIAVVVVIIVVDGVVVDAVVVDVIVVGVRYENIDQKL